MSLAAITKDLIPVPLHGDGASFTPIESRIESTSKLRTEYLLEAIVLFSRVGNWDDLRDFNIPAHYLKNITPEQISELQQIVESVRVGADLFAMKRPWDDNFSSPGTVARKLHEAMAWGRYVESMLTLALKHAAKRKSGKTGASEDDPEITAFFEKAHQHGGPILNLFSEGEIFNFMESQTLAKKFEAVASALKKARSKALMAHQVG